MTVPSGPGRRPPWRPQDATSGPVRLASTLLAVLLPATVARRAWRRLRSWLPVVSLVLLLSALGWCADTRLASPAYADHGTTPRGPATRRVLALPGAVDDDGQWVRYDREGEGR